MLLIRSCFRDQNINIGKYSICPARSGQAVQDRGSTINKIELGLCRTQTVNISLITRGDSSDWKENSRSQIKTTRLVELDQIRVNPVVTQLTWDLGPANYFHRSDSLNQ